MGLQVVKSTFKLEKYFNAMLGTLLYAYNVETILKFHSTRVEWGKGALLFRRNEPLVSRINSYT